MISRDEFIDGYIRRSELGADVTRTPTGFVWAGEELVALPCDCGWEDCEGWSMESAKTLHLLRRGE